MKRPVVGITPCLFHHNPERITFNGRPLIYLEQSMSQWIYDGGFTPIILPIPDDLTALGDWIERQLPIVDGLLVPGGVDVAPESYNTPSIDERWPGDVVRDTYEMAWIKACYDADIPILGICRGHQIINVCFGGTLFQDIRTQTDVSFEHRRADIYELNRHVANFTPGTPLAELYGTDPVTINSVHHQAVKTVAPDFAIQATSHDGLVEGIYLPQNSPDDPYVLGVQWHPEFQDRTDEELVDPMPLLSHFARAIDHRKTP